MLSQKHKTVRMGLFTLIIFLLLPAVNGITYAADAPAYEGTLITTHEALKAAVSEAKDGDTLYVGDIDCTPASPYVFRSVMEIEIGKSLTIKSGKANGQATLIGGSFYIKGSKVAGERITVRFEGIILDGCIDTAGLTANNYPDEGFYGSALRFAGNVNAAFDHCMFTNYTNPEGAVMNIRYDDYTANEYMSSLYTDQSGCRLELSFSHCSVTKNAALYSGGAFYIDGNRNVTLTMTDCTLSDNRAGVCWGMGGGGMYAEGIEVGMTGCTVTGNCGNHVYEGFESGIGNDTTRGGGAYLTDCTLRMTDCLIADNSGSMGGGLALTNTTADLDGCTFTRNRAQRCPYVRDMGQALPWDNMAQGGALYTEGANGRTVHLINSAVFDNTAEVGYGGVYQYYADSWDATLGVSYLKLTLCTLANNTCLNDAIYDFTDTEKRPWCELPGDVWTAPCTTVAGCVVIDSYFDAAFPRDQKPDADNGYNYFASPDTARRDGIVASDSTRDALTLPESDMFRIPADVLANLVGERYAGKLTAGVVGSNYTPALYGAGVNETETDTDTDTAFETDSEAVTDTSAPSATAEPGGTDTDKAPQDGTGLYVGIGVTVCLLIGAAVGIMLVRRSRSRQVQEPVSEPEAVNAVEVLAPSEPGKTEKQTINAKYTEEQIQRLMSVMPEVHTLTDREREVFLEILRGKKLGEISADLYISDSTVKNFYQKIYTKMGVTGKDALLQKIFEVAQSL